MTLDVVKNARGSRAFAKSSYKVLRNAARIIGARYTQYPFIPKDSGIDRKSQIKNSTDSLPDLSGATREELDFFQEQLAQKGVEARLTPLSKKAAARSETSWQKRMTSGTSEKAREPWLDRDKSDPSERTAGDFIAKHFAQFIEAGGGTLNLTELRRNNPSLVKQFERERKKPDAPALSYQFTDREDLLDKAYEKKFGVAGRTIRSSMKQEWRAQYHWRKNFKKADNGNPPR
jgi:hypothetical protein